MVYSKVEKVAFSTFGHHSIVEKNAHKIGSQKLDKSTQIGENTCF